MPEVREFIALRSEREIQACNPGSDVSVPEKPVNIAHILTTSQAHRMTRAPLR